MTVKKRKPTRRAPDLTVQADCGLKVFADKPRGNRQTSSAGIVTYYDPAVVALGERMSRSVADERHLRSVAKILEDCLRTAGSIKSKRGTELVKLLRDARRKVELIET
jgi:hypothetical protein